MNILLILFLSLYCTKCKEILRHVHVLFRHGDRSPIRFVSDNPNKTDIWPNGLGQLTEIGIRQQFALGRWLRKRYGKLLRQQYNYRDINVRSTNVNRTIMSAQSTLAGLYYDNRTHVISRINWRQISVHTVPRISNTLSNPHKCNKFNERVYEMYKEASYQSLFAGYQATLDVMRKITNNPLLKFEESWYIYDYLFCEQSHNITHDSWVTTEIYKNIEKIYEISWKMMYHSDELGRLSGGRFLDKIITEMKMFVEKNPNKSKPLEIISGHDEDLSAILSALGLSDGKRPPYASCLMLELIHKPIHYVHSFNNWVVKIYYKTSETESPTAPKELKLQCSSSQPCTLGDFIDYAKPRSISEEEYGKMCKSFTFLLRT